MFLSISVPVFGHLTCSIWSAYFGHIACDKHCLLTYPRQVLLLLLVRDEEKRRWVRVGFPRTSTLDVTRHSGLKDALLLEMKGKRQSKLSMFFMGIFDDVPNQDLVDKGAI